MGAGKSSIGKGLSKKLKFSHLDTDNEIEKKLGKYILAIKNGVFFNKKGVLNQHKRVLAFEPW